METLVLKLIKFVYQVLIRPRLKSYVESTENQWDDKALEFVDDVVGLFTKWIQDMGL